MRTEEEIRRKYEFEKKAIDTSNRFQVHRAYVNGLEWALEDSDDRRKGERRKQPPLKDDLPLYQTRSGKDRRNPEPKPIEKFKPFTESCPSTAELADKCNAIIDRLNEMVKNA